jgi:deoxyadenosine/deoxycytidine kinase
MQWVKFIINNKCREPHGFIYLQADPDVCHARIGKRKRAGESMIAKEYLNNIHYWHEQFLIQKKGITPAIADVPVLVLDANIDFVYHTEQMEDHAQRISAFIEATCGSRPGVQTGTRETIVHTTQ